MKTKQELLTQAEIFLKNAKKNRSLETQTLLTSVIDLFTDPKITAQKNSLALAQARNMLQKILNNKKQVDPNDYIKKAIQLIRLADAHENFKLTIDLFTEYSDQYPGKEPEELLKTYLPQGLDADIDTLLKQNKITQKIFLDTLSSNARLQTAFAMINPTTAVKILARENKLSAKQKLDIIAAHRKTDAFNTVEKINDLLKTNGDDLGNLFAQNATNPEWSQALFDLYQKFQEFNQPNKPVLHK